MSFLLKEELKTVATAEMVTIITNSDDIIITEIIEESIDLMRSYLHQNYDTEALFAAVDDAREKIVVKYLKDIVIYEIYCRRTRQINELAKQRYDEAMLWLERVAKGEINPGLPTRIDPDTGAEETFMKTGGRKTYDNHW